MTDEEIISALRALIDFWENSTQPERDRMMALAEQIQAEARKDKDQ